MPLENFTSITSLVLSVVGMGFITYMINSLTRKIDKVDELEKRLLKTEWELELLKKK